ncbi:hypothetical protein LCGC14_1669790 [marine sediment metagenome]|uniref:Uncharacterized protein n=1 Tax=marine sediment metagenome TaxID=412755 RepID=A0A0F9IED2_9ZZZZ
MPIWSNQVPKDSRGLALPLKRAPTNGKIVAIVTNEELIGCNTHFWGGHTTPCEGKDCEAHLRGIPFRWHGYLGAVDVQTHLHFIFEMTVQAADSFKAFHRANRTLRGCIFEAKRLKAIVNSRVCIKCKPADLRERSLPKAPDIRKCMAIIWNVPDQDVEVEGTLKDVRHLQFNPNPMDDPILAAEAARREASA